MGEGAARALGALLRVRRGRLAQQVREFQAELIRLRENIQQREVAVRRLGDRHKNLAEELADGVHAHGNGAGMAPG